MLSPTSTAAAFEHLHGRTTRLAPLATPRAVIAMRDVCGWLDPPDAPDVPWKANRRPRARPMRLTARRLEPMSLEEADMAIEAARINAKTAETKAELAWQEAQAFLDDLQCDDFCASNIDPSAHRAQCRLLDGATHLASDPAA